MKASRTTLLLALALGLVNAATAADLGLRHDPAGGIITLTNHLDRAIYLQALLTEAGALPILLPLAPGQSGMLRLSGALPMSLAARGVVVDGQALAGHVAEGDGAYQFSVAIE